MKLTKIFITSFIPDTEAVKRSIRITKDLPDERCPEYLNYTKLKNYLKHRNPSHIKLNHMVLECDSEVPGTPEFTKMDSKKREEIIKSMPDIDYIPGYYFTHFSYSYNFIEGVHPGEESPALPFEKMYHKFLDCAKRNYPYWQTDNHPGNFIVVNGEYEFLDLETVFHIYDMEWHYKLFHSVNPLGWHRKWQKRVKELQTPLYTFEEWKKIFGEIDELQSKRS